jgi:HEPN domain-containing protein
MTEDKAIVQEWLDYSEADLRIAKLIVDQQEDRFSGAICVHSQQCVEKIIKAYLVSQNIPFPKSHDLLKLNALIQPLPADWPLNLDELDKLTNHAGESRYPGDLPDWNTAKEMFEIASVVRAGLLPYFEDSAE